LLLLAAGFAANLYFFGDSVQEQVRFLAALVGLVLLMVFCAALLLGVFKLLAIAGSRLISSNVTTEETEAKAGNQVKESE
jgi:hypothetical protein